MNDDLISRQALMKEFADFVKRSNNSDFAPTPTWNDAVSLVGSMPSAQPEACKYWDSESNFCALSKPSAQPEIIRCKDCKHWGIHKWLNIPWCREMHIDRGAEDFCSIAERRTDGRFDQQTGGD